METGGQKMPNEWIDKTTGHKIIKLSRMEGGSYSFYFHNNPFIGNKMVFYNTAPQNEKDKAAKQETYNINEANKQIYMVDLKTLAIEQLTHHPTAMNGEIVSAKINKVFYQVKDSIFSVDVNTKKETLVFVFPEEVKKFFPGDHTHTNEDGARVNAASVAEGIKLLKNLGLNNYLKWIMIK